MQPELQKNVKKYTTCEVVKNTMITSDVFDLWIHNEEITKSAVAGQFVNVYVNDGDLLLPRPISICEINRKKSILRLVYRIVGKGTERMSKMQVGQNFKVIAPLGNGFTVFEEKKKVCVIGGGIGTPPMLGLCDAYLKTGDVKITALLGFKDETILISDFNSRNINTYVATDCEREGCFHGNVLKLAESIELDADIIYACGPKIMLKNVAEYAKNKNIPCYVSMEERMGCGFGACVGCICKTNGENGEILYKKVCTDGPVFDADKVCFS